MFCSNCGKKMNNDQKFCGVCGFKINTDNDLRDNKPINRYGNIKKNINTKVIAFLILLLCIGGIYMYKSYTCVNNSREKVVKEFIVSLKNSNYEKFVKTIYLTSKDYKEDIDLQKNFFKETTTFGKRALKELGENWDEKLIYIANNNNDKVEILFEGKTFMEVPTIKIKDKYYIDVKLQDLI